MKKFTEAKGSNRKNLLIVDSLNLSFRWKHKKETSFANKLVDTIRSLASSYEAKKVIVLGDAGSIWRKAIYPEYKANRKEKYADQTEQEKQEFEDFILEYSKGLEMCTAHYPVFRLEGIEADDIAAYITKHYAQDYEHTWLISTDADWDLLLNNNVSRFSYTKRKEITLYTWSQFYDYEPEDHIHIKVLMGDSGDNVPGVPGIGPTRARQLIRDYGDGFDIHASLPLPGTQKYIQALNKFGNQLLTNYELMDLMTYCDDVIGDLSTIIDKEFK